jgi:hypothetical protein
VLEASLCDVLEASLRDVLEASLRDVLEASLRDSTAWERRLSRASASAALKHPGPSR